MMTSTNSENLCPICKSVTMHPAMEHKHGHCGGSYCEGFTDAQDDAGGRQLMNNTSKTPAPRKGHTFAGRDPGHLFVLRGESYMKETATTARMLCPGAGPVTVAPDTLVEPTFITPVAPEPDPAVTTYGEHGADKEIRRLRAEADVLKQERDDARAEVERMESARKSWEVAEGLARRETDNCVALIDRADAALGRYKLCADMARIERDIASAEVERLWSTLRTLASQISTADRSTLSLAFTSRAGAEELASLSFRCSDEHARCIWDALTREAGDA